MKKTPYFQLQEQNINQIFGADIFKLFSSNTQLKRNSKCSAKNREAV